MSGGGGGSTTVGYRYYWDIQSGLGRGPVNEIVELRVDDKTAYVGTPGELTRSKAIYIDKPNLFGGEDTGGEGGIKGRMEILMGEPDQVPSEMLVNLLKGQINAQQLEWGGSHAKPTGERKRLLRERQHRTTADGKTNARTIPFEEIPTGQIGEQDLIPGFRGVVTTVFSGLISCFSAYPKKHAYRVRRTTKGWHNNAAWYPEKCRILLRNDHLNIRGTSAEQEENVRQIHAMNPAHILVECATNQSWGGKKALSDLDLDSYKKAADQLYAEGFGLCLRYNRHGSLKNFVQQVIDHISAVQYDNVETGKQAIRLLRDDYNADELPLFHYDNGILKVQDDDSAATNTAANQIIVKFRDPLTNKDDQAIANNIAAIRMHGVISKTVEYKGVPTFDLATRLAQRDLEMTANGLTRLKLVCDMRASELRPGDVIKVHLPDRDIENAIFRVMMMQNGNEGEFILTCMLDMFGLPAVNYSSQAQRSLAIPVDFSAKPIKNSRVIELPYQLLPLYLSEERLANVKPTLTGLGFSARTPKKQSVGFTMLYSNAGGGYDAGNGSFTPFITLTQPLAPYDTTVHFAPDSNSGLIEMADALMIDDEIIKIDQVDTQKGIITVGRGCADTIPQAHNVNSLAWAYLANQAPLQAKFTPKETVSVQLVTKTTRETLNEAQAPHINFTTTQRQGRPYPPANVRVNGELTTQITTPNAFTLTWAHRDKWLQMDKLFAHDEPNIVDQLPKGVRYVLELKSENNLLRRIDTTETTFTYPDKNAKTDEGLTSITLYTTQDGLQSRQQYEFIVI